MKLTQKQVDSLTTGKKHWSLKKTHVLGLLKSYTGIMLNDDALEYVMEVIVPREQKRLNKIRFEKNKSENKEYAKVEDPKEGAKYHLSWAQNGCVWRLSRLLPDGKCELVTPKTRKRIIANQSDLLHTRKATNKIQA